MNIKNLALVAAFCASGLAGCGPKGGSSEGNVTVDFNGCVEKPIAELGDSFHSSKRYVALHADTPELMIGEVGKVVLHGDRIFVNEKGYGPRSDHKLVVHDADGCALGQVGHKGRGPGEFLQIVDFDVDADGRVHIYDGTAGVKKIFVYGADSKFIGEKQLPFSAGLFHCTPDGGYIFELSPWDNSEHAGKRFAKTDADLNVLSTAEEYDMSRIDINYVLGDGGLVATPEGFSRKRHPTRRCSC